MQDDVIAECIAQDLRPPGSWILAPGYKGAAGRAQFGC
jgi:hypothetical protein